MAENGENGENGARHTYALSKTHQNVSFAYQNWLDKSTDSPLQMLEKSLVDSDPEIAEIMVNICLYDASLPP